MAKDTPNKPDEVKKQPASGQPEQNVPAAKSSAAEAPPAGEVVVSADKINELAGSKRKASAKAEQDKQEQKRLPLMESQKLLIRPKAARPRRPERISQSRRNPRNPISQPKRSFRSTPPTVTRNYVRSRKPY